MKSTVFPNAGEGYSSRNADSVPKEGKEKQRQSRLTAPGGLYSMPLLTCRRLDFRLGGGGGEGCFSHSWAPCW